MPLSVNVNLDVPDLPDNDVAFANNAAWVNYWSNINLEATFDTADNDLYVESAYNDELEEHELLYNDESLSVPSIEQFNSLLLAYQTLNTNYKELRDVLKAIGLITNSQ